MEWKHAIPWLFLSGWWLFLGGAVIFGIYTIIKDGSLLSGIKDLYRQFFGNLYSADQKFTLGDGMSGCIYLALASAGLLLAFEHINYNKIMNNLLKDLITIAIMAGAYHAGKHFSCLYSKRWANYLSVYFGIAVLTIIAWATYGTHTEDADPMFGGGTEVVDFTPSREQRSDHAGVIFFSLLPAALVGVYRGQNNKERKITEVLAAMAIVAAKAQQSQSGNSEKQDT